jgi:hypothetical protein
MNAQDGDICPGMTTRSTGESSPSSDKELEAAGSGSKMDAPLASPTRLDSSHLQSPVRRDHSINPSCWRDVDGTKLSSSSPLPSTYGFWCTCVYDGEDITPALPLAPCFDGDIFGIGKRPVQYEIEMDGCVRLVFVEE